MFLEKWSRQKVSLAPIASAVFALLLTPPLLLAFSIKEVIGILVALGVSMLLIAKDRPIEEKMGFLASAVTAILVLSMVSSGPSGYAQPWVFAIPAAMVFVRPWLAILLTLTTLALTSAAKVPVDEALRWLFVSGCVSALVYWSMRLTVERLTSPIRSHITILMQLILIFLLYFVISTSWFALLFSGINTMNPGSFTSANEVEPTSLDFFIFSGMINTSGAVVHLSPAAPSARLAVLAEMVISFAFMGIYFAIAVANLMDSRAR